MAITDAMLDEMIGTVKTQDDVFGKDGLLNTLSNRLLERMFDSELTHHLGYGKHAVEGRNSGNSRSGKTTKTIKTNHGELELAVPRDRNSNFEPVLIEKRKSRLNVIDDLILSLYGKGMTVRDIQEHVEELYGTEVSADLVSTITDGVLSEVAEWRNCPLDKRITTRCQLNE